MRIFKGRLYVNVFISLLFWLVTAEHRQTSVITSLGQRVFQLFFQHYLEHDSNELIQFYILIQIVYATLVPELLVSILDMKTLCSFLHDFSCQYLETVF